MEKTVQIPVDFPYRDVLLKGRPEHDKYDPFTLRHPPMPASRWAKIYAPFDALRGFKESVTAKTIQYVERRILSEYESMKLNRKLIVLKDLIRRTRISGQKLPEISVTYFRACRDVDSEAYGYMGTYETITGVCRRIDTDEQDEVRINQADIRIRDITNIEIYSHFEPDDDVFPS